MNLPSASFILVSDVRSNGELLCSQRRLSRSRVAYYTPGSAGPELSYTVSWISSCRESVYAPDTALTFRALPHNFAHLTTIRVRRNGASRGGISGGKGAGYDSP